MALASNYRFEKNTTVRNVNAHNSTELHAGEGKLAYDKRFLSLYKNNSSEKHILNISDVASEI